MRTPTPPSPADLRGAFERVATRPHARWRFNTCFSGGRGREVPPLSVFLAL